MIYFGKYPVDGEGKQIEPISWRVLKKSSEGTLLIAEKILDIKAFSSEEDNKWEHSPLKNWLNDAFLKNAFSEQEQERLIEFSPGEKVSLIGFDDYFDLVQPRSLCKAKLTDYAKKKWKGTGTLGFWWTKSANIEIPSHMLENPYAKASDHVYVFHICNVGTLNGYRRCTDDDGVRPIICLKN